jgi:hypothetical protein
VRLGTRSAASQSWDSYRRHPAVRQLGLLLATVAFVPGALWTQLTTGTIEGTLRAQDGRPVAGLPILITGGAGFRTEIRSNSNGEFTISLPYGRYRLSLVVQHDANASGAPVFIAPLQIARFDLIMNASGAVRSVEPTARTPGIWTDATSGRLYPEAFSLTGLLADRYPRPEPEPASNQ